MACPGQAQQTSGTTGCTATPPSRATHSGGCRVAATTGRAAASPGQSRADRCAGIELLQLGRQGGQSRVHVLPDGPPWVRRRYSLLGRQVTEERPSCRVSGPRIMNPLGVVARSFRRFTPGSRRTQEFFRSLLVLCLVVEQRGDRQNPCAVWATNFCWSLRGHDLFE